MQTDIKCMNRRTSELGHIQGQIVADQLMIIMFKSIPMCTNIQILKITNTQTYYIYMNLIQFFFKTRIEMVKSAKTIEAS